MESNIANVKIIIGKQLIERDGFMNSGSWKQEKRPVLHIPLSPVEIVLEIAAVAGIVFTIFTAIQAWPVLPNIIPTHFGASGKIGRAHV